jgi:L-threonylcarbamoyladenylate synthase
VVAYFKVVINLKTKVFKYDNKNQDDIIAISSKVINQGGLVVFPTETVYGIGANALDKEAARRIYNVKGRPSDNPLIVHLASKDDVKRYTKEVTNDAMKLINAFWPGPLTIVLTKTDVIPFDITGGLSTVALRMPSHPVAKALIKASKVPICAPSANISGRPSSTLYKHVYEDLFGKVDVIIDGGQSMVGLESTVLDMTTDQPTILRPGAITKSMIETILNQSVVDETDVERFEEAPKAPGMKYKHYAPKGKVTLLKGTHKQIIEHIHQMNHTIGVIASNELCKELSSYETFPLGPIDDKALIAKNIFLALRTMDEKDINEIYIEAFEEEELGQAIMNRLIKASGHHIIHLK